MVQYDKTEVRFVLSHTHDIEFFEKIKFIFRDPPQCSGIAILCAAVLIACTSTSHPTTIRAETEIQIPNPTPTSKASQP
jgi:hypothetical protein